MIYYYKTDKILSLTFTSAIQNILRTKAKNYRDHVNHFVNILSFLS